MLLLDLDENYCECSSMLPVLCIRLGLGFAFRRTVSLSLIFVPALIAVRIVNLALSLSLSSKLYTFSMSRCFNRTVKGLLTQ